MSKAVFEKGIDVSKYQGTITTGNFLKIKQQGYVFVLIRAVSTNSGGIYIDPCFEQNYKNAKAAGLKVGVYYYTYANTTAVADKELALFFTAIKGKQFEYPVVVDVEDNWLKPLSAKDLTDLVLYALNKIQSAGYYAMLYTYYYYQNTELDMARLADYDLWIACYTKPNYYTKAHGIWQYSSKGRVSGISGNVDVNYSYKDYAAIIKNAGLNGFSKQGQPDQEPQAPSQPPVAVKFYKLELYEVTKGDIESLKALAEKLEIKNIKTTEV